MTSISFNADRVGARFSLVVISILLAWLPFNLAAQLFGPKNFEECVLDKMKGQSPNMIGIARAACYKQFPSERLLTEDEAQSTWCETTYDSISACVKLKDGAKITKAMANFSRASCESANLTDNMFSGDQMAEAKIPFFGSTFKFELKNASQYKCARFLFYGYVKE